MSKKYLNLQTLEMLEFWEPLCWKSWSAPLILIFSYSNSDTFQVWLFLIRTFWDLDTFMFLPIFCTWRPLLVLVHSPEKTIYNMHTVILRPLLCRCSFIYFLTKMKIEVAPTYMNKIKNYFVCFRRVFFISNHINSSVAGAWAEGGCHVKMEEYTSTKYTLGNN